MTVDRYDRPHCEVKSASGTLAVQNPDSGQLANLLKRRREITT
jgi:hypothetical protein